MLRSMYAGISGLKNSQTKLDVIGNNVANVNTYGFKKGRVTFSDAMSQTLSGPSGPTANQGGVNAKQIGLGSTISTIDTIHSQSSIQTTGRDLDLAISGDGYFVVKKGEREYYTRAGNFYLDAEGTLVDSSGAKVQGKDGDIKIESETYVSFTISQSGEIIGVPAEGASDVIAQLSIARFANTAGLIKSGGSNFETSVNSGEPVYGYAGEEGRGIIATGTLEMSNVDLSEEFTEMIVAQRSFQSNSKIITTSDEILQELLNLKR
ncbi:flagellar basal body rod protein FlgG [Peribacillus sp. NPDC097225]|uniref:flagellar basal body rod protein FlgG n=1 Tax=Peribacillus sp. NPDC097225 TaxID=3364400 RepID=UPI0038189B8F